MIVAGLIAPWWLAFNGDLVHPLSFSSILAAVWPLILAAVVVALCSTSPLRKRLYLPEGDLIVVLETMLRSVPLRQAARSRSFNLPPGCLQAGPGCAA